MKNLTQRESQVLLELIKNAKMSDQEIARKIGTSRPTVIKIRKRLEKSELIKKYTVDISLERAGYEINATTLFRWDDFSRKKELEKTTNYIRKNPQIIRFSTGKGIGSMTHVIVSVHKNLKEYEEFWQEFQEQAGPDVSEIQVFLSTFKNSYKNFDLTSPIIHSMNIKK